MTVYQTVGTRQWKAVIHKRWETNEVRPTTVPSYCLQRVYRPWCREKGFEWKLSGSLCWGDGGESPRRMRLVEFTKQNIRWERAAQTEIGWESPLIFQQSADWHVGVYVRKHTSLGKESSEKISGYISRCSTWLGRVPMPAKHSKNSHNSCMK